MQSTQAIELRKSRSVGDIINLTFTFLRENFKLLMKSILFIAGPPLVVAVALGGLSIANSLLFGSYFGRSSGSLITLLAALLFLMLTIFLVTGVVTEYVALYAERNGKNFEVKDVWDAVRRDFWAIILTSIATTILTTLASILFILPGIYLYVVYSTTLMARIHEDLDLSQAMSRSFELIKNNWWNTFGIIVVMVIIGSFIRGAIELPVTIITMAGGLLTDDPARFGPAGWALIIMGLVSALGALVVYVLPALATSLHYFNLVEKLEGVGLMGRIEMIGEDLPSKEEHGSLR